MTPEEYMLNRERFEYICGIIGDEYLREELTDMMEELDQYYTSQGLEI